MNHTDLPPIPKAGTPGSQVCAIMRLYLAVLDDLPAEQVHLVFEHIDTCAGCAAELKLLTLAKRLLPGPADLPPPSHVDQAVLGAIATWSSTHTPEHMRPLQPHHPPRSCHLLGPMGQVAAAVMLLIAITIVRMLTGAVTPLRVFVLPANLSWSGYVLFYRETKVGMNDTQYRVNCYHDLGTGRMHVETIAGSDLDIVVVGNDQVLLGKDLIHHIAQWDANAWSVDDSMFDLAQLRSDLQANRASYEGVDYFHGQEVYRIRRGNGLVLLLDRHYWPVNVLSDAHGPGTGAPIYETLTWLKISQVPGALWDIRVPAGFRIGDLPAGP
jgi:hypothetical protein